MPAAPGSTNRHNGRIWQSALHQALEKRGRGDKMEALRALADRLIDAADGGDMQALRELGDRLDGKAAQAITGADGGPFRMTINADDAGL